MGQGWIDHQWGSSWTTMKVGWDWWGIQLDDGRDILMFQQRDLATGKTFYPLATFMDNDGNLTVTRKIVFKPVRGSAWRGSTDGVRYPLAWDIRFPEQNLKLHIAADVKSQDIPILSPAGDIWEGSCSVTGSAIRAPKKPARVVVSLSVEGRRQSRRYYMRRLEPPHRPVAMQRPVHGVAYMELVGYSSPAVRKQVR